MSRVENCQEMTGPSEGLKIRGVPVLFGWHNLPPLVEIGLTDLPKFGGAMALPGTTGLIMQGYKFKTWWGH